MTFDASLARISRAPVSLVVLTLDRCANVYGVAPCTGSANPGEECYNTFPTCQDKANFDRATVDYKFYSHDGRLMFSGARPYLKAVKYMPTEIKKAITVRGRVNFDLLDEPDGDVGIDPYLANRPYGANFWAGDSLTVNAGWIDNGDGSFTAAGVTSTASTWLAAP